MMKPYALGFLAILTLSCLALTLLSTPTARADGGNPVAVRAEASSPVSGGTLPLYFEPNLGQTDPEAQFVAHGAGYTAFLTSSGPVLATDSFDATAKRRVAKSSTVRVSLGGVATDSQLVGEEPLDGKVNYLLGSDESSWVTDVPTFASVRWQGVYDGVDVRFHSAGRLLEYDFEVAPGADASQIRLGFDGQKAASVDENGDLVLAVAGGEIRQQQAVAYQDSPNGRRRVGVRYEIGVGGEVSLALDAYDTTTPLVVDPIFVFNDYIGSDTVPNAIAGTVANSIAVDGSGAAYVSGYVEGLALPTPNGLDSTPNGQIDAFVAKLSPDGASLVYATYLGGSLWDVVHGLAIDAYGSAYVAGETESSDFPTTQGVWDRTLGSPATFDGFVAKLSATGSQLVYSTYLGGTTSDRCNAIALDASGDAFVTGQTMGDYPTTPGAFTVPQTSNGSVTLTKISADGQSLVYSTFFGEYATGASIAIDSVGAAYVAGSARGQGQFPTTPMAFQTAPNPGQGNDGVILKMSPGGDALVYSTYIGGSGGDKCRGIALDQDRNAYVVGDTTSADFPAQNQPGYDHSINGAGDAFVAKLAANGDQLVYCSFLGGSARDVGYAIAVDSVGNAYAAGVTDSSNFPVRGDTSLFVFNGTSNGFVAKFGPTGTTLPYSTMVASSGHEYCTSIARGPEANTVYVAGATSSATWPSTGFGPRSPLNALVAKIRISIPLVFP